MRCSIDPGAHRRRVSQVHGQVMQIGAKLGGQGDTTVVQHVADDHPGTRRQQGAGKGFAQATRAAGDQHAPARQLNVRVVGRLHWAQAERLSGPGR